MNATRLLAAMCCLVAFRVSCAQTEVQNLAAFHSSGNLTRLSYHWDHLDGGVPAVATGPRQTMPYAAALTTITFDPLKPEIYQQKTIGGVSHDCVLLGTFTNPNYLWDQPGGTQATLTYSIDSTTHYIFPYVTVGSDLRSYLRTNYFASGTPNDHDVALRIDQSLGLDPSINLTTRGLAFFWAPIANVVRSGYLPDVSAQVSDLEQFPDGSYMPKETGLDPGFRYVDYSLNTILYTTNEEFVANNQAKTAYPWTAMGYTYNWNHLQDGTNPDYGLDPLAPDSPVGLAEFMVSGGSQVILESWIPYSDFDLWIIPEPGSLTLVLLGLFVPAFVWLGKSAFGEPGRNNMIQDAPDFFAGQGATKEHTRSGP
jgi:hypothetical protein